jgi:microcystin degradation protein MlrC
MKIAIASLIQESNTFSPVPTTYEDLDPVFGDAVLARHEGKQTEVGGFISVLREAGATIIPISAAWSVTKGRVLRADLDRILQRMLPPPVDGALVALHGAQTAEGIDDVEGLVLSRWRAALGANIPLIATLDLHANVTRQMVDSANAIVGYRTYPHIDMYETGRKAARILIDTLRGECRPVMRFHKLPLIINAENQQTTNGPMADLRAEADRLEKQGNLRAISLFPVQPWLDIEEMGCAVTAISDGDADAAQQAADAIATRLWNERELYAVNLPSVEAALAEALATEGGPVVLAESSDSTGSGSPGDSTGVLKVLLETPLTGTAAIFLVDPPAVSKAFEAGVGKTIELTAGGHFDRVNSTPVKMTAYIRLLSDGRWTSQAAGYNTGIENRMGRAAVIEVGHVKILLAEKSAMTVDPELFRSHGINPDHCKIVVVKSPNGFRAAYAPIAKKMIVVDTPGVSTANLARLPWKRVTRPIWPLDAPAE